MPFDIVLTIFQAKKRNLLILLIKLNGNSVTFIKIWILVFFSINFWKFEVNFIFTYFELWEETKNKKISEKN